jgi:hypothetical protein
MPSLLEFVFDKKKPIPGEWEYDMHPGPYSQEQVYDAPLYQGDQGGLMDDWIPDEEPYKYPGVKFVTRGPYDEEAGKYTSETLLGEWEIPGTEPLVSYFKPGQNKWDLTTISKYNMDYNDSQGGYTPLSAPGKIPDYMYANPNLSLPENPWPEYADAEGYAEEAIQPFSRGPDGITPVWSWKTGSDSLLTGGSDGITTPIPSIPSPTPMPMPIPDNSLPTPIEEYNSSPHGAGSSDQFEYFLDSVPPGVYTHESMLQDFLGRPPNDQELYMLDLRNNQYNMPVIDPDSWEPPPNNNGLLGIVGGGLIPDAGPISDSPIPTY